MKIRNIPFGYQMENGRITLYPAESGTVREIFTAYLDGQSLLQIANSLNERNIEYKQHLRTQQERPGCHRVSVCQRQTYPCYS